MGINFPDGTQNHSGKLIQSVDNYYSTITSFSTQSNTLQRMWTFTFTPKMANSRIVHFAEFHGYYGSSGADRNFSCGMNVNGGTHYHIGGNPNSQPSGNNPQNIMGYHRGDTPGMAFVVNFQNVFTGNSGGMPSWSAGDTLAFWADCVGENTYYHCQASQQGQGRFGRGRSKIILAEYIP